MSKLIAFRLPNDLAPLFEAKCEAAKIGVTEALVQAVRLWLGGDEPQAATSKPTPRRPAGAVTVVAPKRRRIETAKVTPARKPKGFDPVTREPIYS